MAYAERSLEELIVLLASCRLDSRRASDRIAVVNEALNRLQLHSLTEIPGKPKMPHKSGPFISNSDLRAHIFELQFLLALHNMPSSAYQ